MTSAPEEKTPSDGERESWPVAYYCNRCYAPVRQSPGGYLVHDRTGCLEKRTN